MAADQPSPAGGRRQWGGERGRLCPKDPYRTTNGLPVSNQRLPEILDDQRPPAESRRDTGRRHPTGVGGDWGWGCRGEKVQAPDWHRWKLRLGWRRGEGSAPGDSAPVRLLAT